MTINQLDLEQHKKTLLSTHLKEDELMKITREISQNFTSKREKIGEYVLNKDYVSAYNYFYLPTNIPKFSYLMDQLPLGLKTSLQDALFIDWATGPGTYLLAYMNFFNTSDVIGIDTSTLMLEQARKNCDFYFANNKAKLQTHPPINVQNNNVYLHFGNGINEMKESEVTSIIQKINPQHVSFIEPGTPEVFKKILKIRNFLKEVGFNCAYPCSQNIGTCPMAKDDWCHQVLKTKHHQSVERFSQLIKLDRKSMPMIAHFYTRQEAQNKNRSVTVRFLRETKFSFDIQVCEESTATLEKNSTPTLKTLEILKKHMTKKEKKEFKELSVGTNITYEKIKEISEHHFKCQLKRHE
jgi:hypothetical protein